MRRLLSLLLALWLANPAFAQVVGGEDLPNQTREVVLFPGVPHLPGAVVDLNFAKGPPYYTKGATGPLSVSRASSKTCADLAGNWYTVGANVLCRTNQGALIEEARTNLIPCSGTVSCGASPPSTYPTGVYVYDSSGVLTASIAAVGVTNGLQTIDISLSGSPINGQYFAYFPASPATGLATYGQTFTTSAAVSLVAGSATNVSNVSLDTREVSSSSGTLLDTITSVGNLTPSLNRFQLSHTILTPATYYANSIIFIFFSGGPVNLTYRIAVPQLELNPNISATVASAVKTANGTGGTNGTAVYTVSGGTCSTQPTLNVTWAAGVLTVNSVANAGSCSVLPPSPATLAYASGTATGWTGATVTLTPTDYTAQGFATSPIITTGSPATRAADNISLPVSALSGSYSLYSIASNEQPAATNLYNFPADLNDGTYNNDLGIIRSTGGASSTGRSSIAGSASYVFPGNTYTQNVSYKVTVYVTPSTLYGNYNNGTVYTVALAGTPTVNTLSVGSILGASPWNGYVSRIAVAKSSLLPY